LIWVQTFADWDVVLVDDGSTDGTRTLAEKEPRLAVYEEMVNLGTYGTEQRALDLHYCEFIAIMNSDDLSAREKFALRVASLAADPEAKAAYVLGGMVDDAGNEIAGEDVHADWPISAVQDT
jgi:glycosyltransferase involved in cell wall biosynthesis